MLMKHQWIIYCQPLVRGKPLNVLGVDLWLKSYRKGNIKSGLLQLLSLGNCYYYLVLGIEVDGEFYLFKTCKWCIFQYHKIRGILLY